jgi:hypothetical protein
MKPALSSMTPATPDASPNGAPSKPTGTVGATSQHRSSGRWDFCLHCRTDPYPPPKVDSDVVIDGAGAAKGLLEAGGIADVARRLIPGLEDMNHDRE